MNYKNITNENTVASAQPKEEEEIPDSLTVHVVEIGYNTTK